VRPYVAKQLNDETMKNNRRTVVVAGLKPAPARVVAQCGRPGGVSWE
jgi:hypothetical protein